MNNQTFSTLFLAALLTAPLQAATLVYNGVLQGSQEVPANASTGTGSVLLTLNDSTGAWTLTGVFSGLTGTSSNAHIHGPAAAGVNAGVVTPLTFSSGVTSGTLSGSGTFSAPQMADLSNQLYYVNLHSSTFGGGELRAQLVPEPSSGALLGVAALVAFRRRRSS